MKTKAAMLREPGSDWEIAELELDEPKANEVLIRWVAAGLCHSDEHLRHGDIVPRFPIVGGHEGAGRKGVVRSCDIFCAVFRTTLRADRTINSAGRASAAMSRAGLVSLRL